MAANAPQRSVSPFFVVGCPRSGTTLLRDLLRSHPSLTLPAESHFIPPFYAAFGEPRSDAEERRLALAILACPFVKSWGLRLTAESLCGGHGFASMVRRLFGAWAAHEGRARWGDKTPQYVLHLPLLARLFPDARFVHVVRDGRDVALSLVKHPMGPRNVVAAARLWKRCVTAGRAAGVPLGTRYHETRFEELLSAPDAAMSRLLAFLEEPFTEAVLERTPVATPMFQPLGLRDGRPVADNQGHWRRHMSRSDRALFEWVAGDLLQELGFECEGAAAPSRLQDTLFLAENHLLTLSARANPLNVRHVWPSVWMAVATGRARVSTRWSPWR